MTPEKHSSTPRGAQDINTLLGQRVRVEESGAVIREGRVEAVTEAGDLFWIGASGCDCRAIYGPALGHQVIPLPDETVA